MKDLPQCFIILKFQKVNQKSRSYIVCGKSAHAFLDWEKEIYFQAKTYLCICVQCGLCLAFISCIYAGFFLQLGIDGLLTWVRKDKQIYMHACI